MTDPDPFRRVVVRAPGWLGDAILSLPAAAAIRRHFAAAHLAIAAPASIAPIFREETPVAPDEVIELPDSTRDAVAILKKGSFDAGILFPNSFRSAWQFRRAGIGARWGYGDGRPRLAADAAKPARTRRGHAAPHRLLPQSRARSGHRVRRRRASAAPAFTGECGSRGGAVRGAQRGARRRLSSDLRPAQRTARPSSGRRIGWRQVIARLAAETPATCVIVGAAHDREAARAIESWLRAHAPAASNRVVDLVGRTNLGTLVGVAARAAVFVSNDSGAMHVAAAVGRPVVAIFGPTDERVTRPIGAHDVITQPVFCRPCQLRDCPIDHRCMKRITVDTIVSAVTRRLAAAD